ncbi:DNA methyltransferase [Clostridium sp. HMP27]|uniref:DNA methyltransferase n=1 Tax=Clostridium sp. HMP27 TaxID=1487921 RepID=UPI00052DB4A3|nr:DNA methyltransferase [Clostridium sp. HMP27]KGK86568.1 methylase [Clostridium sp. HMP27]
MSLSWNEIRKRAIEFSNEWKNDTKEQSEAKTFWDDFFNIFGIKRKRVASFEEPVKKLGDKPGFIDLFWKGTLIVEHKSKGKNLDRAYSQALDYFAGLKEEELPKYVIVSDFLNFRLYDLEADRVYNFETKELYKHIHLFSFILGQEKEIYEEENVVNIQAAELMGKLHDMLKGTGYVGHALEVFLVRIMFCLFADNTEIFNYKQFYHFIKKKTKEDGSDTGMYLSLLFQVLDTNYDKRQKNLDEDLNDFRYINGALFREQFSIPTFDKKMRDMLLQCCRYDWSGVSPVIFGSMFQFVMDSNKRINLGAHYTSEQNILKVINDLFLNDLQQDFYKNKNNKKYLKELLKKIKNIKILDPSCGCGNFLVVSYMELRKLEMEIKKQISILDNYIQTGIIAQTIQEGIDVDSMYGIEIEEFPTRIAQVALWLVDHQMNMKLSQEFGQYFVRLPLLKSANIFNTNALSVDWEDIIKKQDLNYILGNPPFISKKNRLDIQNKEMEIVFKDKIKNYGVLDYVCCWYIKTCEYIKNTKIEAALVSTNSITQGEQVVILWDYLLKENIKINFAHRSFKWSNETKNNAQVHVSIIGFSDNASQNHEKFLYDYETPSSTPIKIKVNNINPYLVNQEDFIITSRKHHLDNNIPKISFGNMPNDDGNFLFTNKEKEEFLNKEPEAEKFIRPFISAKEFLNGEKRWCLWLNDCNPQDIKQLPEVMKRIEKVKDYRLKSKRKATKTLAEYPYLFGEIRQPNNDFIVIPRHSSENRKYIPIAFLNKDNIVGDSCCIIKNVTLYHFGVLTSLMHMTWIKYVCGRIKSDYRYSNTVVYNNFPWPQDPYELNKNKVEKLASELLAIRAEYKNESLSNLYNALLMPKKLNDIHKKLDRAVDLCYRKQPFDGESKRIEYLFGLYQEYIVPST